MANRLAQETSPYLLQHADNPVDWYPWGDDALRSARQQDKPILLSIGYAACHWCHVMAHESFDDPTTAEFMNEHFINIKVDREERPDLDDIYMSAVTAMTGQGGWPMTVVLTPGGEPFFGGTYFPPEPRYGMPSFRQVLVSIVRAWQERRDELVESAVQVAQHIRRDVLFDNTGSSIDEQLLTEAVVTIAQSFDEAEGGFGPAPKFPQAMTIEFLLRRYQQSGDLQALHMAELTLEKMAHGGMYDQIGGGFARYSTDNYWLVPHFEKMLYDNALLSRVYLHAWQVTGRPLFRRIVEETLDWALTEMRHESGGFYSSLDADSEGEEGRFYVWKPAELRSVLGEDATLFMLHYDVTENGNWEGKNILRVARDPSEVAALVGQNEEKVKSRLRLARRKLYEARSKREWPGLDDKVLTSWNGLMLASLAEAGRDLKRSDFTDAALTNAEFLLSEMRDADGRLFRSWKSGSSGRLNGYLEDYVYLADGLLALYQNNFDARWFQCAEQLALFMLSHFQDSRAVGFFDTSDDHESLIHRPKQLQDNATPSGNAMAAGVLMKLSLYTGRGEYWDTAVAAVSAMEGAMRRHPTAFAHWLGAADLSLSSPLEVAVMGTPGDPDTQALLDSVFATYQPNLVVASGNDGATVPLLAEREMLHGEATAYVCRNFICELPVTEPDKLSKQLRASWTIGGKAPSTAQ